MLTRRHTVARRFGLLKGLAWRRIRRKGEERKEKVRGRAVRRNREGTERTDREKEIEGRSWKEEDTRHSRRLKAEDIFLSCLP